MKFEEEDRFFNYLIIWEDLNRNYETNTWGNGLQAIESS